MRLTEKVEKSRVIGQYKEALQQMSQVSLKAPGAAVDYAEAAYATLDIRCLFRRHSVEILARCKGIVLRPSPHHGEKSIPSN